MKNLLPLPKMILSGLLFMQLYSCMPPLYYPNGINAPLLSKKGQFVLNGGTDGTCTDIQMAAGASDNIGVILNVNIGSFSGHSTTTTTYGSSGNTIYSANSYGHEHSFFEAGTGVFNKIGTYGRTETFGLIGFGSAESSGGGNSKSGSYMRMAVQSDIGIETNFFEGIFSCRMGYLDLSIQRNRDNYNSNNYNYKYGDPSSLFIDPAITIRMGWKGFKVTTQFGVSIPFNGESSDWNPGWATIGVQLKFI